MADRPPLTYEAFVALAMLYGLDMDEEHLRELFPEVEAMHDRIAALDGSGRRRRAARLRP